MLPLPIQCAAQVAPATMTAIVRVESGGNPWALYNNNTGQSIHPPSYRQALADVRLALAMGQKMDVGLAQVDTENFAAYGLTPASALNACTNLHVGAEILATDYHHAASVYGPGQVALFHAFEAYNSGRLHGDAGYADKILAAAGWPVFISRDGIMTYRHRQALPLVFVTGWSHSAPMVAKRVAVIKKHGLHPARGAWSPFALGWVRPKF